MAEQTVWAVEDVADYESNALEAVCDSRETAIAAMRAQGSLYPDDRAEWYYRKDYVTLRLFHPPHDRKRRCWKMLQARPVAVLTASSVGQSAPE